MSLSPVLDQPPWSVWSKDNEIMQLKTGLTKDQFEYIQKLAHNDLIRLRMRKRSKSIAGSESKSPYLSIFNILLVTLTWIWSYPKNSYRALAKEFHSQKDVIQSNIKETLEILAQSLEHLRMWPQTYRGRIASGRFEGAIGCVDSFPIYIQRPGIKEQRSSFYQYKTKKWAYKVQIFVSVKDGRIMDVTNAFPYGAFAEQKVFRQSVVYQKLDQHNLGLAGEGSDSESDAEDQKKGLAKRGLADKGYKGIPSLYTPHKHSKKKKLTTEEKEYNRELSGIRSVVEQVQGRMKQFNVIGTTYRGRTHDEEEAKLLSVVVKVIASLVNYKLETQPIRRSARTIKHPKPKKE